LQDERTPTTTCGSFTIRAFIADLTSGVLKA
jgi:hypothetical protein